MKVIYVFSLIKLSLEIILLSVLIVILFYLLGVIL